MAGFDFDRTHPGPVDEIRVPRGADGGELGILERWGGTTGETTGETTGLVTDDPGRLAEKGDRRIAALARIASRLPAAGADGPNLGPSAAVRSLWMSEALDPLPAPYPLRPPSLGLRVDEEEVTAHTPAELPQAEAPAPADDEGGSSGLLVGVLVIAVPVLVGLGLALASR